MLFSTDEATQILENITIKCSVSYIKDHKQKQNTKGTYDFEKVLCFALCSEKQKTRMVLCEIKKYFADLLRHYI